MNSIQRNVMIWIP